VGEGESEGGGESVCVCVVWVLTLDYVLFCFEDECTRFMCKPARSTQP